MKDGHGGGLFIAPPRRVHRDRDPHHITPHHDVAGETLEIQRAARAVGDAGDRTRQQFDDGLVEAVR